jgi:hypothetical protein
MLMILYDFCLLPAQFCCIIVYMWEAESCVQIEDRCAPWKISNGMQDLVMQALSLISRRDKLKSLLMSKVKFKVTLRLTVSQSVSLGVELHLGLMARYLLLVDSYGLVFCRASSLTRGRVCLLYMMLTLASAAFLGSKSLGTRAHTLLSQISDFPFRCLLHFVGSRCSSSSSSSLLPATSQHGHSWHRAPLGPIAIYLFSVKTFFFLSLFLL